MRATSVRASAQVKPVVAADRLRELARDVRRIGDPFRHDPEAIAAAKDEIAFELVRLARRLEGGRL